MRGIAVLVDINAIIEAHRAQAWRPLVGAYAVETVEDCVTETQTGFQRRRREQVIEGSQLRESLANVHAVSDLERAELAVRVQGIALDLGEWSLWAHALSRAGFWVLCGPDKASLRCGVRLGFRERLVSLEGLLRDVGHRPKLALRRQYTRKWLDHTLGQLVLEER
ncbi:MAG: hypothetical protein OXU70_07495 [Gammaproteobacteria bacterium]|nr:hypothetical protein [Gammaproteobacteria bacterium]